jgi:hypothetical protein
MKRLGNCYTVLMGLFFALALSACGSKSGDGGSAGVPTAPSATVCSAGMIYSSQHGQCLQQGNCGAGSALYNNQCVMVGTTVGQTCQAGYVQNQTYGCLAQAGCPVGYGMYNNQCILATNTSGMQNGSCQGSCPVGQTQTSYGCLPQDICRSCYGYSQTTGWCYPATSVSGYGNVYNMY